MIYSNGSMCSICHESGFRIELSCGCKQFCESCICGWFEQQLQSISGCEYLLCPTGDPRHELPQQEFYSIARGSEWEEPLERVVLRRSLRGLQGVAMCPSCEYTGWIDVNQICNLPVECEECGYRWFEVQLLSKARQVLYCLKHGKDNFLSECRIAIRIEWCPWCGIPIEDSDYCSQVRCLHCHHDYCGYCFQMLWTHDKFKCLTKRAVRSDFACAIVPFLCFLKLLSVSGKAEEVVLELSRLILSMLMSVPLILVLILWAFGRGSDSDSCLMRCFLIVFLLLAALQSIAVGDVGYALGEMMLPVIHCCFGFGFLRYI